MEVIYLSYPMNKDVKMPQSSMAIGFFDGVHLGHQMVIGEAITNAKKNNLKSSVMTFDPHPKQVFSHDVDTFLITPLNEKIKMLEKMGLDIVYVVSFSELFSKLSPEEFIEEFLIHLNVSNIAVGFDFTFGRFGLGKAENLKNLAENRFSVTIVPPIKNHNGLKISSTLIRENIKAGKIMDVNDYLGWYYLDPKCVVSGSSVP